MLIFIHSGLKSLRPRVMVFNATFNNISVIYRGCQFYWWRKTEYLEKTANLPQITDKLHQIMKSLKLDSSFFFVKGVVVIKKFIIEDRHKKIARVEPNIPQ